MNHQPLRLYSLIKLHKQDFPIRPVVSTITLSTHKLSEYLIDMIVSSTKFITKFSIKISTELIENVKNTKINNQAILISFTV